MASISGIRDYNIEEVFSVCTYVYELGLLVLTLRSRGYSIHLIETFILPSTTSWTDVALIKYLMVKD